MAGSPGTSWTRPRLLARAGWRLTALAGLLSLLGASPAAAQVNVTATAGTPAASYTTLKGAFDAVNAGTHQGVIGIAITGDTTETASAVLNASGSGAASYTSLAISPSGGALRTIAGAIAAGSPLLDLNGADNVTIDGLNTGGDALTISNTTVSATSGTSTIRFQADATNNLITRTSILGSSTMATTTNGGNIWFGAAAVATGSDNNTISNCNIGPAGANLPTKAIYGNGSTTTTAVYNSGVIITNNNIFDYFNAAAQSNGIYLGNGNTDWTISNNRFYQTATRTHTTASLHAGIQIAGATGNNNHVISANTIGYASAAGTGTYTLVGNGAGSKFLPIYFSAAGTTTASSIQGNTITAISLSGVVGGTSVTGAFVGISINAGIANIGNVAGNTVGSLTTPGAVTVTSNNAAAMEVYGIYYFPTAAANVSNNVVAGLTATNSGAGSLVFYGIRAFTGSAVTNTMQNNTVGSATAPLTVTSAATATRAIGLYCQSGACIVTGNTVSNLSMSAANVGTGSTASVIGLWIDDTSATLGNNVSQNTVRALANNEAAAAVWVTGLHYNGATTGTHVVQRNFIHTLSTPSTSATATVNGINVQGGLTTYQNNMIALGNTLTANGPQINGINETVAGTDNFYHNSVYIGGSTVAAGTANTFAFQSAITLNTRNFRDNIFFNARSNGAATGKHYALRVGGTAPNPAGLTSNNNVLFANGVGGVLGLFNLVDQPTLSAWQGATGQDGSSFVLDPRYLAPTAAPPDLHIDTTVVTPIEGNGAAIAGVNDDFDGQLRAGLTPTDIGADAGNFIGADLTAPGIVYTPFSNTSLTTNRTLTTSISDVSGVAAGGLAPRIYYRKGAGSYVSQACALVSGSTWDCFVNNGDVGGVTTGDVITYFVIAQDTVGNLASNPPGVVASDVNTVTSPPGSLNSYTIVTPYSGSYDVGTGQAITSLTNAGGLFELLNAGALTGNVVINLTSDLTGELGTNALNQWPEDGVGNYSLLIRPSGGARTITGTNTGALIRLNGTDRVRLDGSTSATFVDPPISSAVGGNPALRELTIQNTNTGTSAVVISVQSGTAGAQNNTLRNLNVLGQDPTTTLAGIAMGGNTPGTAGTDNDGNRVQNCTVKRAIYGIYSAGLNAANPNTGTVITQNDLSATTTDRVRRVGIFVVNDDGAQVSENSIGGIETNESADAVGIAVGAQALDASTVATGNVTNALVARNRIAGVSSTSTTGFSAAGITVAGGAGTNTIANNMISGVISPATAPDVVAGLFVAGVPGSTTRLFHNSVALAGDRGAVASQSPSFALAVTGTDPTVISKNNILVTSQTSSGGGLNAKSYTIGMVTSAFVNLDSNFNDFHATGVNAGFFRSGSLGAGAGTDYATLGAWAAAVSDDANSLAADPLFTSASDLHIVISGPLSPVEAAGTPLVAVTNDFDGDARSATAPTIGADEVIASPTGLVATPGNAHVQLNWNAVPSATAYNVKRATVSGGPYGTLASGVVSNSYDDTSAVNGTTYYYVVSTVGGGPEGRNSAEANATPEAPPAAPGGLVATPGNAHVQLNWNTVVGAASYNVKRALVSGGPYTTIASGVVTNSYDNTGLTNGTTYFYVVSSVGTVGGEGVNSSEVNGTPLAPPPAPTGLAATPGNAHVQLNWNSVGGASSYNVKRALVTGGPYTTIAPSIVTNSYDDTGVTNGTTYFYVVSAIGTVGGEGANSSEVSGTPLAPPAAPTGLVATPGNARVQLAWNTVAGADSYNVKRALVTGGPYTNLATGVLTNNYEDTAVVNDTTYFYVVSGVGNVGGEGPNSSEASATPNGADVAVAMTVSNAAPTAGQSVTFTITVTNNGSSTATGVAVTDRVPAGLTYTSATPSTGSYAPATGLWTVGSLINGGSATLQIVATANVTAAIVNKAVKTAQVEIDPDASNNAASAGLNAGSLADVRVNVTVDDATPATSQAVTFTVTANNRGPASVTGLALTDLLPAGLTHSSSTPSTGTYTPGSGVWTIGTLASGASATLQIVATVGPTTPITNVARISAAAVTDPDAANDFASVTLNATSQADLALDKSGSPDPTPSGANLTYLITVSNIGPTNATNATVADTLPAGLSSIVATSSQGSCTGGPAISCNLGTLAAGASALVRIDATKTVGGSLTLNSASVSADQTDPFTTNNSNTAPITPVELQRFEIE